MILPIIATNSLPKDKLNLTRLFFKEANWYLYAFCLLRQDFRLFKLRRMSSLEVTASEFAPREFSIDSVEWDGEFDGDKHSPVVVAFDQSMKLAVNDIFGVDNYETQEDGRLKVKFNMGINSWLYGFILGFGDKIEVLEPSELRDKIKNLAENVCKVYRERD